MPELYWADVDDISAFVAILIEKPQAWLAALITSLPNLVVAVIAILVFGFSSRWVKRATTGVLARVTRNGQIAELLGNLSRFAMITAGIFIALELLHLDKTVTSLLAGIGVIGLALGFAFQDIAANFMAGFIMAIKRPFEIGDLVDVSGQRGRVKQLDMRSTELETPDGLSVIVPNNAIFQNAIVNYTRTNTRRLDIPVGTAYGDSMTGVREAVTEAVRSVPHRERSRDVEVFFESFGDFSINFVARVWLEKADELTYLTARSEGMIAIKDALDRAGYTIPFPIRTLDFGANAVGGEQLDSLKLQVESRSGARDSGRSASG
jgi:small conductance mechanosensitive channel